MARYKSYDKLSAEEKRQLKLESEQKQEDFKLTIINRIRDGFREGIPVWKQEWMKNALSGTPRNGKTGKDYTGFTNIVTCLVMQERMNSGSSRWFTAREVKDINMELKGKDPEAPSVHIRKGEKGSYLTAFIPYTKDEIEKRKLKLENKLGHPVNDSDVASGYFKYYVAFNECQIENLPKVKEKSINHIGEMTPEMEKKLDKFIEAYCNGEGIKFGHMQGNTWSDRAFYSTCKDSITIPPKDKFHSLAAYYSTAFHEMAHSTGHKSRQDRFGTGLESYAREELVAETAACMLCAKMGIEADMTFKNSLGYLGHWAKAIGENKDWLFNTMEKAGKAMERIYKYEVAREQSKKTTVLVDLTPDPKERTQTKGQTK